ncbi:MAG: hypothetical protein LBS05_06945 [Tannerellaceae bacterium]|jgi:uncharacterized iron-regulated protein|nr:hypothetical protein [Tannerellaceae bacterium]
MKRSFRYLLFGLAAIMMVAAISSCEKDGGGDPGTDDNDALFESILKEYVESTVVPTYKSLAEAALEMRAANEALKTTPSDETMKAASDAWMTARIAWEISEAFLFGPVGEQALDIDGHIDSWPLEKDAIDAELENIAKAMEEGKPGLTGKEAWQMDAEVIGFHVTEYLLYRDGQPRPVGDLTPAERNYLVAATDALVWDCVLAYVAWVGEANVTAEMRTVFNENPDVVAHLANNPNYNDFAKRLTTKEGYSSWGDALSEIAVGAGEIADEVGATKIEAPYAAQKTEDVESWYSWHSLHDYQNNIQSIKNAYLGGFVQKEDNSGYSRPAASLSAYLAQANPALDTQIKAKIDECLTKIAAIGTGDLSFYEVVRDQVNKTQVDAAVTACGELATLFSSVEGALE